MCCRSSMFFIHISQQYLLLLQTAHTLFWILCKAFLILCVELILTSLGQAISTLFLSILTFPGPSSCTELSLGFRNSISFSCVFWMNLDWMLKLCNISSQLLVSCPFFQFILVLFAFDSELYLSNTFLWHFATFTCLLLQCSALLLHLHCSANIICTTTSF